MAPMEFSLPWDLRIFLCFGNDAGQSVIIAFSVSVKLVQCLLLATVAYYSLFIVSLPEFDYVFRALFASIPPGFV